MHTPTPWNANNIKDDPNDLACAVWDKSGDIPICSGSFSVGKYNEVDAQTKHDNMLFIAQAVNAHEAMKEALKLAAMRIGCGCAELPCVMCRHAEEAIDKALAVAEGKEQP